MPLRWEVLHDQKLIHVIAEGPVTIEDMEEHFDALASTNVLRYAKLFDATRMKPLYDDNDVLRVGARLSAYTFSQPSGPLAVIGKGEIVRSAFKRFINISPSKRPAKMFRSEKEARAWLASVADDVADQSKDEIYGNPD
ncbi:hypothetical protein [Reyranella sp.]|uniref:hypothetical protein n=1 Tax=Reyranella sp. TaxID=1929291 RepID=UPI003BA86EFB